MKKKTLPKLPGFGINVEVTAQNIHLIATYIETLQILRVSWVRLVINFYEPPPLPLLLIFVKNCKINNINILGALKNLVPGTVLRSFFPHAFYTPVTRQKEKFSQFVRTYVSVLSHEITHWEILNEMDSKRFAVTAPDPSSYIQILSNAKNIITSIDKNAQILFAGMVGDGSKKLLPGHDHTFFQKALDAGARKHFDIASVHLYTLHNYFSLQGKHAFEAQFTQSITNLKKLQKRIAKPIWITEYGISPRWVRIDPATIASLYIDVYRVAQKAGMPFFLWHLADTRTHIYEPGNPEKHFGLLTENLTPKPLFLALREKLSKI